MNSRKLLELTYVLPKSRDDPAQIQRSLDDTRIKNIGQYVQRQNSFLPNNIVLNLSKEVRYTPKGDLGGGELIFPAEKGKYGYILDGQHRLYGFKHSNGTHFDLPVAAFINAPKDVAYKVFADINSLQSKVNEVLLQLLRYEIQDIEAENLTSVAIVHDLNNDADSVLKGRIKVYPQDRRTWIKAPTLVKFVTSIIGPGGALQGLTKEKQKEILMSYFKALKNEYPFAWGNRNYLLTKSMGIEIACTLFQNVYQRCQRYENGHTSIDAFRRQLKRLGKVNIPPAGPMEFDWSSKKFGALSSHKGRGLLKKQLLLALPPINEARS
jgi:DGQHR domain-containing protein